MTWYVYQFVIFLINLKWPNLWYYKSVQQSLRALVCPVHHLPGIMKSKGDTI